MTEEEYQVFSRRKMIEGIREAIMRRKVRTPQERIDDFLIAQSVIASIFCGHHCARTGRPELPSGEIMKHVTPIAVAGFNAMQDELLKLLPPLKTERN